MRKETYRICKAFVEGRSAKGARTNTDGNSLFLHGHRIAWWDHDDRVTNPVVNRNILNICFCGYPSPTTKDRLNGLLRILSLPAGFFTRNYQLYFGSILRPVDAYEILTLDVALMEELSNDNTITPSNHHTIAA